MKNLFKFMLLCVVALGMVTCGKDNTDNGGNAPGPSNEPITFKSCKDEVRISSIESTLDIEFTASAAWSAKSSNIAWLSIEQGKSGKKGTNTMRLRYKANNTSSEREGTITVTVDGFDPVILVTLVQGIAGDHADFDVNASKTDLILSEKYLWNDEYNELIRDYAQDYRSFLSNTLLSMQTNGDDGGVDKNGRYLYSYIIRSATGRSPVAKTSTISMGITGITLVQLTEGGVATNNYAFCIQGVNPDSPAANAGLVRGDMITRINNSKINSSNYNNFYYDLLVPSNEGITLSLTTMDNKSASITSKRLYLNPVLKSKVITSGTHKIGYIAYEQFEASFDDELLAAFKQLRDGGATELILDLRINGGGHVMTSQMISTIIAGSQCEGKIYQKYRYNDTRMREMGLSFPENTKVEYFGASKGDSDYSTSDYMNLSRAFFLVSNNTASSSEFTFHALRGIDFPVTLIGKKTEGKNVGMEPQSFQYGDFYYEFLPITFQGYNAKNESPNPSGTEVDYDVDEWTNGLSDWGEVSDPLVSKAIELITGSKASVQSAAKPAAEWIPVKHFNKPSIGAIARRAEDLPTCGE